jgi:hypothetical protein
MFPSNISASHHRKTNIPLSSLTCHPVTAAIPHLIKVHVPAVSRCPTKSKCSS